MEMTDYPHGMFCWNELVAQDLDKAKAFYCELLGWTTRENPIDDQGNLYIMLLCNGKEIGAMYAANKELANTNESTYWLGYVAVNDIDRTVKIAKKHNADVIIEGMEVPGAGRMALLRDPVGAKFALWHGTGHKGALLKDEPGSVCWNELATKNKEASIAFYQDIFNWKAETQPFGDEEYTEFKVGGESRCGMIKMTKEWGDVPPHWMTYFAVENCDLAAEKAASLGATICVPPTDIEGVGRFAVINDPQGATFSVIHLTMPSS